MDTVLQTQEIQHKGGIWNPKGWSWKVRVLVVVVVLVVVGCIVLILWVTGVFDPAAEEKAAEEKAAAAAAAAAKKEIVPKLKLTGPDARISGDFELQSDKTVGRKHYDEVNWAYPNGAWSDQVWKHTSKPCYIYDHNETDGNHFWNIGPWNSLDGGPPLLGRYAYIHVSKETVDTNVAKYKESQKNPLESWDVMQFGWFHNGWDWTAEAQKGKGSITLVLPTTDN